MHQQNFITFNQVKPVCHERGKIKSMDVACATKVPDVQDSTCISIANGDGIRIFSLESNKIVFSANIGAIKLCQMLNSTSLLAYVGSGQLLVRRIDLKLKWQDNFLVRVNLLPQYIALLEVFDTAALGNLDGM